MVWSLQYVRYALLAQRTSVLENRIQNFSWQILTIYARSKKWGHRNIFFRTRYAHPTIIAYKNCKYSICWLKDLRKLDVTLNKSMVKFRKRGGDDWKNAKYVYAISSIQVSQYQLREVVTKLLKVIDDIMEACADMCMSGDYMKSSEVESWLSTELDPFEATSWTTSIMYKTWLHTTAEWWVV